MSVMQTAAPPYTEEHIVAYPVEYIAGIDLYNAGEYHAAHDAWEERWMGPVAPDEKLFLQAMIQSAFWIRVRSLMMKLSDDGCGVAREGAFEAE